MGLQQRDENSAATTGLKTQVSTINSSLTSQSKLIQELTAKLKTLESKLPELEKQIAKIDDYVMG